MKISENQLRKLIKKTIKESYFGEMPAESGLYASKEAKWVADTLDRLGTSRSTRSVNALADGLSAARVDQVLHQAEELVNDLMDVLDVDSQLARKFPEERKQIAIKILIAWLQKQD